jgi:ADP-dependent NAD(P)H-hydrate dehydratase / NAD(P)H-hydrate epimerase
VAVEDLPAWLTPLPDAETMRGVDRWASEQQGVATLDLMERAGAGVARAVERVAPDGPVAVLCGKGNNGGDGLVVARLLREAGREVLVLCTDPPAQLAGDARTNLDRLPGEPPRRLDGTPWEQGASPTETVMALEQHDVLVDALLGTGFQGEPHGAVAAAIRGINAADLPVVSVDVPSGVDASTGIVRGEAVRAEVTVTFHVAKPGLWIRPGKAFAGTVKVVEIGIPRGAPLHASIGLLQASVLERLPRRGGDSNKFISGHVVLVGGSVGLTGAPMMAAHAAMRAGAGYVTALVPATVQPIVAASARAELMTMSLPDAQGAFSEHALQPALEALARGGALALGPGLGRLQATGAFARGLAREARVPAVIDADALNAHAGSLEALAARQAPTVLTPHAGELGRLLDLDSAEIQRERLTHVREAAQLADAIVVLKGDDTLIAGPHGTVAVSQGGSPALATAGTGDVLTGVIATFLAQGMHPFVAAAAGVLLHARAGRLAARTLGTPEAVIAGDVIDALPSARAGSPAADGAGDG